MSIISSVLFIFENIYVGILARALCGICVGFNSAVVPLYINEISPISVSGLAGSFN